MRFIGTMLVLFGVALLIFGGVTFFIPQDRFDMGALSLTVHESLVIPVPPVLGAVLLIVGVIMIVSAPAPPPPLPPY